VADRGLGCAAHLAAARGAFCGLRRQARPRQVWSTSGLSRIRHRIKRSNRALTRVTLRLARSPRALGYPFSFALVRGGPGCRTTGAFPCRAEKAVTQAE
jgi:hypothetical protein